MANNPKQPQTTSNCPFCLRIAKRKPPLATLEHLRMHNQPEGLQVHLAKALATNYQLRCDLTHALAPIFEMPASALVPTADEVEAAALASQEAGLPPEDVTKVMSRAAQAAQMVPKPTSQGRRVIPSTPRSGPITEVIDLLSNALRSLTLAKRRIRKLEAVIRNANLHLPHDDTHTFEKMADAYLEPKLIPIPVNNALDEQEQEYVDEEADTES